MRRTPTAAIATFVLAVAGFNFGGESSRSPLTGPTFAAAGQTRTSVGPDGRLRLGVVLPSLELDASNGTADMAASLRTKLMELLARPAFDVQPIAARLPAQISLESRKARVDYLVSFAVASSAATGLETITYTLAKGDGVIVYASKFEAKRATERI